MFVHFNRILHIIGIAHLDLEIGQLFFCKFSFINRFITVFVFLYRPQLLKNALQRAVERGQLEQITGKGASGTFQVRGFQNRFYSQTVLKTLKDFVYMY